MPPALIAALPLIIGATSAGVGATELGLNLSGAGKPSAPSPYPTTAQVGANKNQLASTVQQNLGNLQEAGGGGLSPNYLAEAIGSGTGNLNNISELQDIIKQFAGGSEGGGGGTPNLAQLAIPSQSGASLSEGPGLADASRIFGG